MDIPYSHKDGRRDRLIGRLLKYEELLRRTDKGNMDIHVRLKADLAMPYIREALQRIKYGVGDECKDCHETIVTARLDAVPGAVRCTQCQERHDQETRHGKRR